jgi:hypothetical protein
VQPVSVGLGCYFALIACGYFRAKIVKKFILYFCVLLDFYYALFLSVTIVSRKTDQNLLHLPDKKEREKRKKKREEERDLSINNYNQ